MIICLVDTRFPIREIRSLNPIYFILTNQIRVHRTIWQYYELILGLIFGTCDREGSDYHYQSCYNCHEGQVFAWY